MTKPLLLFLSLIVCLCSCSKKETPAPPKINYPSFYNGGLNLLGDSDFTPQLNSFYKCAVHIPKGQKVEVRIFDTASSYPQHTSGIELYTISNYGWYVDNTFSPLSMSAIGDDTMVTADLYIKASTHIHIYIYENNAKKPNRQKTFIVP